MKISASVYSSKGQSLVDLVASLDQHGIDYLHIDCNDDPAVFDDIAMIREVSSTPIDLHLITANPEQYFERINALKIELCTLQHEAINGYQYNGGLTSELGLAIVSETPVEVFEAVADQYKFALMMATTPGMSGGRFDKINFRKVRQFKRQFPKHAIHVDGGVNAEVSFILRNLGVDAAVVGSYLFNDQPIGAALLDLKSHDIESHYTVGDFMRSREESPILATKDQQLETVLQCIEDYKLGFAILEDENQHLRGIVSNADLRREMLRNVSNLQAVSLEAMVNTSPITIDAATTVQDMLQFVKQFEFPINYLPVLQDQQVVGVVSFLNLVKGES